MSALHYTEDKARRAVALLESAYEDCRICPRDCGVNRLESADGAFCRLDARGWVYKELLSYGEEQPLTPTWLLDLGGCSMRCLFCTEWRHVTRPRADPAGLLSPQWFARTHAKRLAQGARTVSFVGGDPVVSSLAVARALAAVPASERLPVVMNCNGWVSENALRALGDVVQTWVIDLKFGDNECASKLAATAPVDYCLEVHRTLDAVASSSPRRPWPALLIRHLLMPGHMQCCTVAVLHRVAARWPAATLNLMTTYLPSGPAMQPLRGAPELNRLNEQAAVDQAIALAKTLLPNLLINGRRPAA